MSDYWERQATYWQEQAILARRDASRLREAGSRLAEEVDGIQRDGWVVNYPTETAVAIAKWRSAITEQST